MAMERSGAGEEGKRDTKRRKEEAEMDEEAKTGGRAVRFTAEQHRRINNAGQVASPTKRPPPPPAGRSLLLKCKLD